LKAIQATPKEVRKVFSDSFVIPDFQRPYSWEIEECETLWDDIVSFHSTAPEDEERYFLGNIVINPTEGGKWSVVDGQQRLTTLLLLIKAFFKSAGTYPALEKCLRVLDKRTDELTDELRVKSDVLAEDAINLHKIIFDTMSDEDDSKLAINFRYFVDTINDWRKTSDNSADALLNLIDTFLDKIVLLPIECGSGDDALTIFQTINNRGMSLTDADIFKAKLYHAVPEQKRKEIIDDWKLLGTPENTERLFRVLMHIIRAESGIIDKEIGLRAFYTANKSKHLANWQNIMASLKAINAADKPWGNDLANSGFINSLWAILETYPNLYWKYPLYVYLHKYGETTLDDELLLDAKYEAELEQLLTESVKYYFLKGAVHNSVNSVRDTTFKVCAAIASEKDYKLEFNSNITPGDKNKMYSILEDSSIGWRYLRGFVTLASYLNPRQDKTALSLMLWDRYDLEHILPKAWNHYDGWTQDIYESHLNMLGNLIPLERAKNIKAQNEFFIKKKAFYKDSIVQDAIELVSVPDNKWTPQSVENAHLEKILRLCAFFELD